MNKTAVKIIVIVMMVVVGCAAFAMWKIDGLKVQKAKTDIRQLLMACISYQTGCDSVWPTNMQLVKESCDGEINDVLDRVGVKDFCYVRPVSNCRIDQPVMAFRCSTKFKTNIVIGFPDGHTGIYNDDKIFKLARELETVIGGLESDPGIKGVEWDDGYSKYGIIR